MRHQGSVSVVLLAAALSLPALGMRVVAQQTDADDGLLRVELTLDAQAIALAYPPTLAAAAHRALLSESENGDTTPIRLGRLESHRALRMGGLSPADTTPSRADAAESSEDSDDDSSSSSPSIHDVWLTRQASVWSLDLRATSDSESGASINIPLDHQTAQTPAATLVAALIPTGDESGRLQLDWGTHRWVTDFVFEDLPPRPRPRRREGVGRSQDLTPASDTTAIARRNLLSERNETALALPDGSRVSVVFWKELGIDGDDFKALALAGDQPVVQLTRAAVIRLKTDVPLQLGGATVPVGNLSPGFAGMYGLWLRLTAGGWSLVLNHEADSWGTQHDPAFDATELALDYTEHEGLSRPLAAILVPTGPDRGRLVLHWGPHEWSADFVVGR